MTAPGHRRVSIALAVHAVVLSLAALLCGVALTSCGPILPSVTTRVLFIGNSYTSYNGGLDAQLKRLAPSWETSSVVAGGYTLEHHWTDGFALASIKGERWTHVVLQEQSVSAVLAESSFIQYGMAFNSFIRAQGASTVLLETWERPDALVGGVTTASLAKAYKDLGDVTGALVAPAGTAFAAALAQRPGLVLNATDGHPTPLGTYLAACVVYGTIAGRTPVGNVRLDPSIPDGDQVFLQQEAARALGY